MNVLKNLFVIFYIISNNAYLLTKQRANHLWQQTNLS
jgi:hypothetical protein